MKSMYCIVLVKLLLVYVTTAQVVYEPAFAPAAVVAGGPFVPPFEPLGPFAPPVPFAVDASLLFPFTDSFLQFVDQSPLLGRVFGAFQVVPEVYDIAYGPIFGVGQVSGLQNPEDTAHRLSNTIKSASKFATPQRYARATANSVAHLLGEFGLLNPSNAAKLASEFAKSIEQNVKAVGPQATPKSDIAAITNAARQYLGYFNILNPATILRFRDIFGQELLAV